ncbi:IS3 family transposase [Clostridioides sp. ES-S-0108-01]|nr:IS3 family transposase [Clostridioides sp. ES-S-0108-01]
MENFFGIMKQEMYYRKTYKSFNKLEKAITEYIYYYNNKIIKEKLNWRSPVKYRFEYESKVTQSKKTGMKIPFLYKANF